jgi:hypothetical protein
MVAWSRDLLLFIEIPGELFHVVDGSDYDWLAPVAHH